MLANELFLRNKNSNKRIVRNRFPIKKIFLDNNQGKVELDENSLDYYDSTIENDFSELQTILSAPLNDSNEERISRVCKKHDIPYGIYQIFFLFYFHLD